MSRREELFITEGRPPKFRATNEECIQLEKYTSRYCNSKIFLTRSVGGVLVDTNGEIQGIWASYSTTEKKGTVIEIFRGFDVDLISDIVDPLRKKQSPQVHFLLDSY